MSEHPFTILLVEDNPSDITLILHALKKDHMHQHVQVIRDGAAALEFFFGQRNDHKQGFMAHLKVLLLDLKLPLVDGLEVLRQVKTHEHTRHLPVVVLSSSREERDIRESYYLGVNSYIVKPVDFDQFTEVIRAIGMYWLHTNQIPNPSEAS